MKIFAGKVVVITGAASGIGAALAHAFAGRGARLLLADIDGAGLDRIGQDLRSRGITCLTLVTDCGQEADVHALAAHALAQLGGADVLINNAGVTVVAPVQGIHIADAHWLMNINFWGVVHGCRAFLPQMQNKPEAILVNISSIFAMVSMPTQSIYNAAKAAVRGFSDALREELSDAPVRVLCLHPGGIQTNIAKQARITDASLVADSPQAVRADFERLARTSPETAAEVIIAAIVRRKSRVLIGADAKVLDLLYRLFPSRASRWMNGFGQWMRRRARTQAQAQAAARLQ